MSKNGGGLWISNIYRNTCMCIISCMVPKMKNKHKIHWCLAIYHTLILKATWDKLSPPLNFDTGCPWGQKWSFSFIIMSTCQSVSDFGVSWILVLAQECPTCISFILLLSYTDLSYKALLGLSLQGASCPFHTFSPSALKGTTGKCHRTDKSLHQALTLLVLWSLIS